VVCTGRDDSLSLVEVVTTTLDPELGLRVPFSMLLRGGWLHLIGNMLYLILIVCPRA